MGNITFEYFRKKFDTLKIRMHQHIANGGSIYDTKHKLPYYDYMQKLIREVQTLYNPEFSRADAHKVCGFDFDPEYNDYITLLDVLSQYADKDGFVDSIKKVGGAGSPKTLLKKLADHIGAAPSDYLILMTNYRYQKAIIRTDYILQLMKEFKEIYPNGGDTTDIKRLYPKQYEKLRHACKYGYEYGITDMKSAAEFFGLENERFSSSSIYYSLQEHEVLKKVLQLCPDRCIDNLQKLSPHTYFLVIKCAASNGLSIYDWCQKKGLTYNASQNIKKLAKTQVDSKKRERDLFEIRDRLIGVDKPKFKTPIDEFHYNKNLAKRTIEIAEKNSVL